MLFVNYETYSFFIILPFDFSTIGLLLRYLLSLLNAIKAKKPFEFE